MTTWMYGELASWWPLLSRPEDYAEEAAFFRDAIIEASRIPVRDVLELGSGGGNNASHMKASFHLTLTDPSEGMLEVSRTLNPECEHLVGDMRTLRLGRTFDAVFVHDAVSYMTSPEDLAAAMTTARVHTRPGGVALFVPDHVRETFEASTDHGGHGGGGRALRYLEWVWDPDPADTTCVADYVFALREEDGSVRVVHDRHLEGVFARQEWLDALAAAGFEPRRIPFVHSELAGREIDVFIGLG